MIKSDLSDTKTEQAPVFERLGVIVRSLHDALRELGAEKVLAEAVSEFPSARERLIHIGKLTEVAANKVINKVEETIPIQDRLILTSQHLNSQWNAAEFPATLKPLVDKTNLFLFNVQEDCHTTHQALSDMMLAQDFQDLTGQLIKKVVFLLEHTENDLLKLLIDAAPPGSISTVKKEEIMAGPGAPGSVALEQGGVDDLLADLGF